MLFSELPILYKFVATVNDSENTVNWSTQFNTEFDAPTQFAVHRDGRDIVVALIGGETFTIVTTVTDKNSIDNHVLLAYAAYGLMEVAFDG